VGAGRADADLGNADGYTAEASFDRVGRHDRDDVSWERVPGMGYQIQAPRPRVAWSWPPAVHGPS